MCVCVCAGVIVCVCARVCVCACVEVHSLVSAGLLLCVCVCTHLYLLARMAVLQGSPGAGDRFRDPVLLLRRRELGFTTCKTLQRQLENVHFQQGYLDYENVQDVPNHTK